jgi:hypothetical protein
VPLVNGTLCQGWLTNAQIDQWNSLLTDGATRYYHFFVNDCFKSVAFGINSSAYTDFTFVIDPNVWDGCPNFQILPNQPVQIQKQEDPRKHEGFYLSVSVHVRFEPLSGESNALPMRHRTHFIFPFLALLLFLPTSLLFFLNRTKFTSVTELNDTRTLPQFSVNLLFVSAIGVMEISRLILLFVFYDDASLTPFIAVNVGVFATLPSAIIRVWMARITGVIISDSAFVSFAQVGASYVSHAPLLAAATARFVFNAFRGANWIEIPLQLVGVMFATYAFPRAVGLAFIHSTQSQKINWFRAATEKKPSSFSKLGFLAYGLVGACLVWPAARLAIDWLFGDVIMNTAFAVTSGLAFTAYASFFGLLKTLHRLKSGRSLWHDDHMTMQFLPAFCIAVCMTLYCFLIRKLYIFDLVGIGSCGALISWVGLLTVAFGTLGSYFPSLLFVYLTIVKPHCSNRETFIADPPHQEESVQFPADLT